MKRTPWNYKTKWSNYYLSSLENGSKTMNSKRNVYHGNFPYHKYIPKKSKLGQKKNQLHRF